MMMKIMMIIIITVTYSLQPVNEKITNIAMLKLYTISIIPRLINNIK